jgi:hypothetical protein
VIFDEKKTTTKNKIDKRKQIDGKISKIKIENGKGRNIF